MGRGGGGVEFKTDKFYSLETSPYIFKQKFLLLIFAVYIPASILYKSIAGCYRSVRVADGPIGARYRFINNAYWVYLMILTIFVISCCKYIAMSFPFKCNVSGIYVNIVVFLMMCSISITEL